MKWPWHRHSDTTQFAAEPKRADLFADPDIVLRKLGKSRKDLAALEYDDEIAAALGTHFAAVASTPWRLEPYETGAHRFPWNELAGVMDPMLRTLWRAVPHGYSVAEVIYAQRGPRIGLAAIHDKPMDWFRPQRDASAFRKSSSARR